MVDSVSTKEYSELRVEKFRKEQEELDREWEIERKNILNSLKVEKKYEENRK